MGAGKVNMGEKKNRREENSRTKRRAAGDNLSPTLGAREKILWYPGYLSPDQFQTVVVVLAFDWCHKTCFFFVPNQRAARSGVVSCVLTQIDTRRPSCSPCLLFFEA